MPVERPINYFSVIVALLGLPSAGDVTRWPVFHFTTAGSCG